VTGLEPALLLLAAEGLLLVLSLVLVVGLAPVTIKVSRAGASVATSLTTAALIVGLAVARRWELETACTTSRQGTAVTANGH
jgi:hypothetical protein